MILQNAAVCKVCKDEVWSVHRHDYRQCTCGSIAVDGGAEYLRRVGSSEDFDDRSVIVPESFKEELKFSVANSIEIGRNELGIALAVIRVLQKNGVVGTIEVLDA
jgi:hypothetical protein